MLLQDGSTVNLFDANGKPSFFVTILEHSRGLALCCADGKVRLTLNVSESGKPSLIMKDANGTHWLVVSVLKNSPGACLFDAKNPDGNTSVQITMGSGGPSLVCVKEGKVLWSAP